MENGRCINNKRIERFGLDMERNNNEGFDANRFTQQEYEEFLRRVNEEIEKKEIQEAAVIDKKISTRKVVFIVCVALFIIIGVFMRLSNDIINAPKKYESFNPDGAADKDVSVTVDRLIPIAEERNSSSAGNKFFMYVNNDGSEGTIRLTADVYNSEEVKAIIVSEKDAVTDKTLTFYGKTYEIPLKLRTEFLNSGVFISLGKVYLDGKLNAEVETTALGIVLSLTATAVMICGVVFFFMWKSSKKRRGLLKKKLGEKFPVDEKRVSVEK